MDRGGICVLEHAKPSMTTSFPRSTTIGVYTSIRYTFHSYLTKQIDIVWGGAGELGFYNKHFGWAKIPFLSFLIIYFFWSNRYLFRAVCERDSFERIFKESLRISTWLKISNFIKIPGKMNENLWESQRILSVIIHRENFGRVGGVSTHRKENVRQFFILPYIYTSVWVGRLIVWECVVAVSSSPYSSTPKKGKKEGKKKRKKKKKRLVTSWRRYIMSVCVYTCVCLYHEK